MPLHDRLATLNSLCGDVLRSVLPNAATLWSNGLLVNFAGKRQLLFALGFLNEGENEAALILALADEVRQSSPGFDVAHLEREAWYYLRTSIDAGWQLDDDPPSSVAALAYLETMLRNRSIAVRIWPEPEAGDATARAALLSGLRKKLSAASA